jgi:prevent-host-death family protein
MYMKRTASIAQARDELAALIHDAEAGTPVEITRRGRPVVILLSLADYERLRGGRRGFGEALASFRDRNDLESADVAAAFDDVRDASRGREVDWE